MLPLPAWLRYPIALIASQGLTLIAWAVWLLFVRLAFARGWPTWGEFVRQAEDLFGMAGLFFMFGLPYAAVFAALVTSYLLEWGRRDRLAFMLAGALCPLVPLGMGSLLVGPSAFLKGMLPTIVIFAPPGALGGAFFWWLAVHRTARLDSARP